ncbi:hypothetical protein AX16_000797 [Volvariella volvacea WC 439]|nr:hypothetical protein AX16_000797 [Volvariella volvacea WC 439]
MSHYISNPKAIAAAVTQIHDWIKENPTNREQIFTHFAVLHAQGDLLRIAAFTFLMSGEIINNLRGRSSNLFKVVELMHQVVQYLNQTTEDNLATMTLLMYLLVRSGIHIYQNQFVCPLHDQPVLPTTGLSPSPLPPPPPSLPQEVATATLSAIDNNNPNPHSEDLLLSPAFTATTPAVIHITQTVTTTPDLPSY